MTHNSKNILHDWKAARMERSYLSQIEFLGSTLRVSFLRAWLVTAGKVLIIFAFMSFHVDVASKMEENIVLLDNYIRNDFSVPNMQTLPKAIARSNGFQPRGPYVPQTPMHAEVAGDSTTEPQ